MQKKQGFSIIRASLFVVSIFALVFTFLAVPLKSVLAACTPGASCTTSQGCPGTCHTDKVTCLDIADNCPAYQQAPAEERIYNPLLGPESQIKTGVSFFHDFVPKLITLALIIGVVAFVFVFIIGAISWITSGGNKDAVAAARGKIVNALIGLVILFSVFAVLLLIQNFFGIKILTLDIGALTI